MLGESHGLILLLLSLYNAYGFLIMGLLKHILMFGINKKEFGSCQPLNHIMQLISGKKDQSIIQELPNGIDMLCILSLS